VIQKSFDLCQEINLEEPNFHQFFANQSCISFIATHKTGEIKVDNILVGRIVDHCSKIEVITERGEIIDKRIVWKSKDDRLSLSGQAKSNKSSVFYDSGGELGTLEHGLAKVFVDGSLSQHEFLEEPIELFANRREVCLSDERLEWHWENYAGNQTLVTKSEIIDMTEYPTDDYPSCLSTDIRNGTARLKAVCYGPSERHYRVIGQGFVSSNGNLSIRAFDIPSDGLELSHGLKLFQMSPRIDISMEGVIKEKQADLANEMDEKLRLNIQNRNWGNFLAFFGCLVIPLFSLVIIK